MRGYISGSGWKDYQKIGRDLRRAPAVGTEGIRQAARADLYAFHESHDGTRRKYFVRRNGFADRTTARGTPADTSLELYKRAAEHAAKNGIIIADTKFEFGLLNGELIWIDEALTPDSSRFWPFGRLRSRQGAELLSTSNTSATIWNASAGTNSRRRRNYRRTSSSATTGQVSRSIPTHYRPRTHVK